MKTILIIIAVAVVFFGGLFFFREKNKPAEFQPWADTEPINTKPKPEPVPITPLSILETPAPEPSTDQIVTAYGMSITVPVDLQGKSETENSGANSGLQQVYVVNGNKRVVTMAKYPDQVRFEEDTSALPDYKLRTNNYAIGGLIGRYYEGKNSSVGDLIVIPSKLAIVQIEAISSSGVSLIAVDNLLRSVKFD